jgi:hypothetical protein
MLSFFWAPVSVLKNLDMYRRRMLWQGEKKKNPSGELGYYL